MTEKLKLCPFCNTDEGSVEVIDYDFYGVRCYCCGAIGPYGKTEEEAIKEWNFRAGEVKL